MISVNRLGIGYLPLDSLCGEELAHLRAAACEPGLTVEIGTRGVEPRHLLRYPELWGPFPENLESTIATENEWATRSIRYLASHA